MLERIIGFVQAVVEIIVDILNHLISLFGDIVDWFKKKYKALRKYTVYIITTIRLKQILSAGGDKTKGLIDAFTNAPVVNVGIYDSDDEKFKNGVVEVVQDNETGNIEDFRLIGGPGIASDLRDAMKGVNEIKLA